MTSTEFTKPRYAGRERRDLEVRTQRDALAGWLDLHPRTLAQVPGPALGALELSLQATRQAEELITRLRTATSRLREDVEVLRTETLTDPLTGVATRRALDMRLAQSCAVCRRSGVGFAVFLLDADNLKEINDTYGHAAGDELLRELARRLNDSVRDVDLVARLGGDEFVLVCATDTAEGAAELASRLGTTLGEQVTIPAGHRVPMSVSLGWVMADPAQDPATLLQLADAAMYAAKGGVSRQAQR